MNKDTNLIEFIFKTTVFTLASVVFAVVLTLLYALFSENVDNDKIFEIIGPAFSTIVGAFVGLLGGLSLNRKSKDCAKDESN